MELVYSNDAAVLLDLAAELIAQQRGGDLFHRVTVIVPGSLVERQLELGVARRAGVSANLRFSRPQRWLARELERGGAPRLDRRRLERGLFALLSDPEAIQSPGLGPLRVYLEGAPSLAHRHARVIELSLHAARAFERLMLELPERLLGMEQASAHTRGESGEDTPWQRTLWRMLRAQDPGLVPLHVNLRSLSAPRPHESLMVFGFSWLPKTLLHALAAYGERSELTLFVQNPSQDFWEDAWAPPQEAPEEAQPADQGQGEALSPLLRWWGRAMRLGVRDLSEVSEGRYRPLFYTPDTSHLLGRVQAELLTQRADSRRSAALPPTSETSNARLSIQLRSCPSPRREVEALAESLWRAVIDEGLRFDQIAIYVAPGGQAQYFSLIESVFREARRIPFHLHGARLITMNPAFELIALLLDLLLEANPKRSQLIEILLHPSFRGPPLPERGAWVQLIEESGAFLGLDQADQAESYVVGDRQNWDQAIRRWALGALFGDAPIPGAVKFDLQGGGDSNDGDSSDGDREHVAYRPVSTPEESNAAQLIGHVRAILLDAQAARSELRTLREWSAALLGLLSRYVDEESEGAAQAIERAAQIFRELGTRGPQEAIPVAFRAAHQLARGALDAAQADRGELLCEGVLVAELSDHRPLAREAIFLIGFDEGSVPRRPPHDPVLGEEPALIQTADSDRAAFLQAILCAKKRLEISWVALKAGTGEAMEPSSLVHQLRSHLTSAHLTGVHLDPAQRSPLLQAVPLQRFLESAERWTTKERAIERPLAEAEVEAELARIGRALERKRKTSLEVSELSALPKALREALKLPDGGESLASTERSYWVNDLLSFLAQPVQGWARHRLSLRDEAMEEGGQDDEPLSAQSLRTQVASEVFVHALCARVLPTKALDEIAGALIDSGRWPAGTLAAQEQQRTNAILEGWRKGIAQAVARGGMQPELLRFGAAPQRSSLAGLHGVNLHGAEERARGAIQLDPQTQLVGHSSVLLEQTRCSLFLSPASPEDRQLKLLRLRFAFRAYVDQLPLVASEGADRDAHSFVVLLGPKSQRTIRGGFDAMSFAQASSELQNWVDVLSSPSITAHDYYLPIEAFFGIAHRWRERTSSLLQESIERAAREERARERQYGRRRGRAIERPWELRRLPPAEALALGEQLFSGFFHAMRLG